MAYIKVFSFLNGDPNLNPKVHYVNKDYVVCIEGWMYKDNYNSNREGTKFTLQSGQILYDKDFLWKTLESFGLKFYNHPLYEEFADNDCK